MSDLAAFQARFARAVMAEEPLDPLSSQRAFAVYRNTSARGAVEALRATFATVDMLIGDEMFTQVALDYRSEHPPADPILSNYGADFADFLGAQPWSSELPYVADVARLDWLWLASLLAADQTVSLATGKGDGRRRIGLHPATRFIWLATPAMTIWQAHRDPDGIGELAPEWREEGALFTRQGQIVRAELITPERHYLLQACSLAIDADECLAIVGAACPDVDPAELLERCLLSGALITL